MPTRCLTGYPAALAARCADMPNLRAHFAVCGVHFVDDMLPAVQGFFAVKSGNAFFIAGRRTVDYRAF